MKNKSLIVIFCAVIAAVFLLGATGAAQLARIDIDDGGKLIGAYITTEPVGSFDSVAYSSVNAEKLYNSGGVSLNDSAEYSERIYAELADTDDGKHYVFTGIDGIACFAARYEYADGSGYSVSGDERCELNTSVNNVGDESSVNIKATVWIASDNPPDVCYVNPVYQLDDGRVYMTAGSGMGFDGEFSEDSQWSQSLKEEHSETKGGKSQTATNAFEITLQSVTPPERVVISEYGADYAVISSREFSVGDFPEEYTPDNGAEYIIVESLGVGRGLYQKSDEQMYVLRDGGSGVCERLACDILWSK